MDEGKIMQAAEEKYNEIVEASTKPADFESTKKIIENFCAKENLSHSGIWHHARGMRDVRAVDPENNRKKICLQWRIRNLAYADVLQEILTPEEREIFDQFNGLSGCEVYTLPNGNFIFLDNPIRHEVVEDPNGNMRLHCETGPAIEFADGSKLFAIDDITVPEWVVMTPAAEIDPAQVLAIEDVDVRMIALRKMGLSKMIDKAREIDRRSAVTGDYVLYDLAEVLNDETAHYLDMINPTTGEHHLEGVDNDCSTVSDALRFRAGRMWNPCQIDAKKIDGGDPRQYQQGDVLIDKCEVDIDLPILSTRELLSSSNQRRHVASGDLVIRGDEKRQMVTAGGEWKINHPEHGEITIPAGTWEVWAVVEVDHITGVLRTVRD